MKYKTDYTKKFRENFIRMFDADTGDTDIFLSVKDAADSLGVSTMTVYQHLRGNVRYPRRYRFEAMSMEQMIDEWKQFKNSVKEAR